jgi:hypothetical protein
LTQIGKIEKCYSFVCACEGNRDIATLSCQRYWIGRVILGELIE